jgi:hypothetical protein
MDSHFNRHRIEDPEGEVADSSETFSKLCGVTSQKAVILVVTVIRMYNLVLQPMLSAFLMTMNRCVWPLYLPIV